MSVPFAVSAANHVGKSTNPAMVLDQHGVPHIVHMWIDTDGLKAFYHHGALVTELEPQLP